MNVYDYNEEEEKGDIAVSTSINQPQPFVFLIKWLLISKEY